jgi:hypothetical protein
MKKQGQWVDEASKSRYRALCETEKGIPLFCQAWWLDAVCNEENWNVALVENGETVIGALPYYFKTTRRSITIQQPALTQHTGPWIAYPDGQKYHSRISLEMKVLNELIEKLPDFAAFSQSFHCSVRNWLPFYWKGFTQTTRYTYIIEDLSNLEEVFANIRSNIKTDIRKADKTVAVAQSDDIDEFYAINMLTFARKNLGVPYSIDFLRRVDSHIAKRACRRIFIARDKSNGSIHAGVYLVWDAKSAYYLMGGGDPVLRNSGATSLLLWDAIQFAATVAEKFDFEGSMVEPVERYFRAFGAIQTPYSQIKKTQGFTSIYQSARTLMRQLLNR